MNSLSFARTAGIALTFLLVSSAGATTVGDIGAFYYSTASASCHTSYCTANNTYGVVDDVVFVIDNTSGTAITNAVLSFTGPSFPADSYTIGTIAPGSTITIEPGVSNDGQTHPSNGLFAHTGSAYDESDAGYPGNATFLFTGSQGAITIESQDLCSSSPGSFTPVCTVQAHSNDGSVANINFLGGPGDNDGPCGNCWGPGQVANLVTVTSTSGVPEPATLLLGGLGLIGMATISRIRRRRSLRNFVD